MRSLGDAVVAAVLLLGALLASAILVAVPIEAHAQVNRNEFSNPTLRFADSSNPTSPLTGAPIIEGFPEDYPNGPAVDIYFRDFTQFETQLLAATNSPQTDSNYLMTFVEAGASDATVALNQTANGELVFTDDAGASDTITMETIGAPWKYTVGKRMWFFTRFKLDSVANDIVGFGLLTGLTSHDLFNATLPTDGVFFIKSVAANTDLDFHVRRSGTSTSTTSFTGVALTDATYRTVGFVVDQAGNIAAYSGSTWSNMTKMVTVATGNANIPTSALQMVFGIKNGSTAAHTLTLDYVYVAQER